MERVAGSCSGSFFAGGRIYLTDEEGKTFVFNARSQYRLVAENDCRREPGQPNCRSKRTGYQNRGPSLEIRQECAIRRIKETRLSEANLADCSSADRRSEPKVRIQRLRLHVMSFLFPLGKFFRSGSAVNWRYFELGCRYCPKVRMSRPILAKSLMAWRISSCFSPNPNMIPDLMRKPRSSNEQGRPDFFDSCFSDGPCTFDRFQVVVENIRIRIKHEVKIFKVSLKSGTSTSMAVEGCGIAQPGWSRPKTWLHLKSSRATM